MLLTADRGGRTARCKASATRPVVSARIDPPWNSSNMRSMPLRKTRRGYEEIPPERCAHCGEPFRPGEFTVGIQHCACPARMHRCHHRTACGHTTLTPPAGENCRAQDLDGR